jgi:hypothetical protein
MKYQIWNSTVLIIEDERRVVDVVKINRRFNKFLLETKEISMIQSIILKRIKRTQAVVYANVLSSLDIVKMIKILSEYYKLEQSDENFVEKYPYIHVPKKNLVTGECGGGAFRHTTSIDPGVKPLVDAINSIRHVRTFSSCCGHGKKFLYVSFKIYKAGFEPRVLKVIDEAFNEVYSKLRLPMGFFKVSYNVGYSTGFNRSKMTLYFYVRVDYNDVDYKRLLEFVVKTSERIKDRKVH